MGFGGAAGGMFNGFSGEVAPINSTSASNSQSFTDPAPAAPSFGGLIGSVGKSIMSLGGAAIHAVAQPVEQAARTVADIPSELAHNAVSATKELAGEATHNQTAITNAIKGQETSDKSDYIAQQYSSKTPGDLTGLEHAGEFGATMLTLGAGAAPADAAETGVGLADRIVDNAKDLIGAGKGNIVGKTVRNAVLVQPTLQFYGKTVNDLANGNMKSAALDAVVWGLPGAASIAAKPLSAVMDAAGSAVFGKASILNDMFTPEVVASYLQKNPNDATAMKQIEQFTLNQKSVGGKTDLAAPWLKNYVAASIPGVTPDEAGLGQLVATMKPYATELTTLQDMQTAGQMVESDRGFEVPASELTVSHNFVAAVPKAQAAIDQAITDPKWVSDMQFRLQAVKQAVGSLGIADETLNAQVSDALLNSNSSLEASANLNDVMQAGQKQIVKDLGNGFVYTSAPNVVAHMPSESEVAGNDIIQGQKPTAVGGAIGRGITKAGLSPIGTSDDAVKGQLTDNVDKRLEDLNVTTSGKDFLKMLQSKAGSSLGVSDLRMLSSRAIKEAVSGSAELSEVPPKLLAGVVRGAYRDLPASMVGAGGKLTNAIMNPLLSSYLRAQGVGRFEMNPFFRGVKVPLKGGIVAVAHGADVEDMMKAYLGLSKDTEHALDNDIGGGWFSASSKAGDSGTVADAAVISTGQEVGRTVKSQITGLVESVAKANGTTPQAILDEKGPLYDELQKGVGLIKGYGKGGYLNSPLAKTLNLVVFPSRFDTKVVMSAGKIMARMSPLAQVAVVHAVAQGVGFLKSQQGQAWAQQNSDALGLLSYFTPTETFQGVYSFFTNGQHVQDLGEIGGLPFGVISTIINSEVPNLGHLGSSQFFEDGQPIASAMPKTLMAKAQTALTDIVSSMFSYPGETVGLGSKTKTIQTALPMLKPAASSVEYQYANGSTEGSLNAPQPQYQAAEKPAPAPTPSQAQSPTVERIPEKPTDVNPNSYVKPAKIPESKKIPKSEQIYQHQV